MQSKLIDLPEIVNNDVSCENKDHIHIKPYSSSKYQSQICSNASMLYERHFSHVLGSMLETGNKFQALLWFYENDYVSRSGHF